MTPEANAWNRLRVLLLLAALVNVFLWGAQGVVASDRLAEMWGITLPEDTVYVRIIGVFALSMGLLYYFASKDPQRNVLIVRIAILKHALLTVILLVAATGMGISVYLGLSTFILGFWGLNLVLCAFFAIGFYLSFPGEERP